MRTGTISSVFLIATTALWGQYKTEAVTAAPAGLPASLAGVLQKEGTKITGPDGKVYCELWLRATPPPTTTTAEDSATLTGVAHGALLAVVNFPNKVQDRRGQPINPGVYTMRLSFYPQNGDHQGVAPQRDFLLLSKAAEDTDPAAAPNFDTLMAASKKVAGAPHPAVFSMWKVDNDFKAGFAKMGESDWVLQTKLGETPVAIILVGKAEG